MSPELLSTLWTQSSVFTLRDFFEFQKASSPHEVEEIAGDSKIGRFLRENPEWWEQGGRTLDWCAKQKARVTFPGEPDYPEPLYDLEYPPLFVSYFGSPCWATGRRLSVVGSREPSRNTLEWMDRELTPLIEKDVLLVSGGARGVDQKAHTLCVRARRPTAVFLPSGLGRMYPADFVRWLEPILDAGGAVLSELAPFEEMKKHYFLKRNRMIAAMSPVVLIAEARRQSGTMITARLAMEMDRLLAAVPGPVDDPRWAGNLELLSSGSNLIRDYWDLGVLMDLKSNSSFS